MDYKDTIHLPETRFPMRASLPQREPEILAQWEKMDLFGQLREAGRGRPTFILHDGPPYANGHLHIGHATNKVLKDIINKAKQMSGYDAHYVPGWDCHGLPIEIKVEQALKKEGKNKESISKIEFRRRCRTFAREWVEIQKSEFRRLGVVGDWNAPYLTMDYRFEAQIARELHTFMANGGLYKGFKPVYWCVHDVTALAEAEVEYQDHTSTTIYVKFPLAAEESLADVHPDLTEVRPSVIIWTTTPWTIPGNLAVSLNATLNYVALRVLDPGTCRHLAVGEVIIVADALWSDTAKGIGMDETQVERIAAFPGQALERKRFRHPFLDQDAPILLGDHVTLEAGTGCVHTAPGHGYEDYVVGLAYGLAVFNPVDDNGLFVPGTPHFAGQHVFKANPQVVALLDERGMLLGSDPLVHSYPHCWRCHTPVISRATPQWFISMETNDLRKKALAEIRRTRWIPAWGEERIHNMVVNRPDWCVSRQRSWGVPITALTCIQCQTTVTDADVLEGIAKAMETGGADIWYERTVAELLPEGYRCVQCGGNQFHKENDILDVWFDSGVTHAAVLEAHPELSWPADLYLEGSDQHRGWFHSSLLASVGTRGKAPYKAVLTHGFVVDGKGRKMSKHLGNVIPPEQVIHHYGADILRMWVSAEEYSGDIRISDEILRGLSDTYRRIRNTVRFLLGNLHGFDPASGSVSLDAMPALDRWALDRLARLIDTVTQSYEEYAFHRVYQALHYFSAMDMGAFYLDIIKDRLYCDGRDSLERRSALTVLHHILETMTRLMAPVFSFTAEEIWSHMSGERPASVHLSQFPKSHPEWRDDALAKWWDRFQKVRILAYRLLEDDRKARRIGSFMAASVTLYCNAELRAFLETFDDLRGLFMVGQVHLEALETAPPETESLSDDALGDLKIATGKAAGQKCARCWNYDLQVGTFDDAPALCSRCRSVVLATQTG